MSIVAARSLLAAAVVVIGAALAAGPAAHGAATTRTEKLKLDGRLDAGHLSVKGTLRYEVPTTWAPMKGLTRKDRRYRAVLGDGCVAIAGVSARTVASSTSATAQVELALPPGPRVATLARGKRPHGAWGIDETKSRDRFTASIAPVHLEGTVYVQIRVGTEFHGACSDAYVRTGTVGAAVERILKRGHVEARVVKRAKAAH